jgi:hypothetical protein
MSEDSPVLGLLVDRLNNVLVKGVSLLEGLVKGKLADLTTHGGLSKVGDSLVDVLNVVRGFLRIDDLNVKDTIDVESNVVLGDCYLG